MRHTLLTILAIVVVQSTAIAGIVIHVPADQPTIQAGVNAASNGDTVLVADGIYQENVKIKAKNIVLASLYVMDSDPNHILHTIIDGSNPAHADSGSCVLMYQGTQPQLIGFTLTGGTGTDWYDVSDGLIYREGGGVLTEANNAIIRNNLIIHNTAVPGVGPVRSAGGGAVRTGFGTSVIEGNVFGWNRAYYGSGVVVFQGGSEIRNNIAYGNWGAESFGGVGYWIIGSTVTFDQNTVVGNHTTLNVGGGVLMGGANEIQNSIVRGNTATSGAQLSLGPSVTVKYCNIQGGFAGESNTSENALFDTMNLLLTSPSACIDSAEDIPWDGDPEDVGNPGFALYPSFGTIRRDKGAYGGVHRIMFPLWSSSSAALTSKSAINFGSINQFDSATAVVHYARTGAFRLTVDSVVCGNPVNAVSSKTPLPHMMSVAFSDSLIVIWKPTVAGPMSDTAFIYHNDTTIANPWKVAVSGNAIQLSCCIGMRGNVNGDAGQLVNIVDLTFLAAYLFQGGAQPPCKEEADIVMNNSVNVVDLTFLVSYLFQGGAVPPGC